MAGLDLSKIRFYPDRQHCRADCAYFKQTSGFNYCTLSGKKAGLRYDLAGRDLRIELCKQLTFDTK